MSSRSILSLNLPKTAKDKLILNGYETLRDLLSTTTIAIARGVKLARSITNAVETQMYIDLDITEEEAANIVYQVQKPPTQRLGLPLTQSVAQIIKSTRKFSTRWPSLDKLLKGGLIQGHVLEVAGPPGSPKETVAMNIACSFLQAGENVLFVDCQNMILPSNLRDHIKEAGCTSSLSCLHFTQISSASELMVFLHSMNTILDSKRNAALLVVNSFSFPFSTMSNHRVKSGILEQVKDIFTQASVTRNLTIVVTTKLATKMVKDDGSRGSFDEGGRGIMVPQLGISYLPPGRSHRVLLSLESPVSGVMYLVPSTTSESRVDAIPQEPYSVYSHLQT